MLQTDELAQAAEDLRREGVDARHSFVFSAHMWIEGLEIDDEFFPLWELMAEDNGDAFERRDFAAIVSRRRPDWSVEAVRARHA